VEPLLFTVPGEPVGKGRPRFRIVTPKGEKGRPAYDKQFVHVYTDSETVNYEKAIAWRAKHAMRGREPFDCPVHVAVVIRVTPAASWSAWKHNAAMQGLIVPTSKPDADNVVKVVLDALNTVAWTDDVMAVSGAWRKEYAAKEGLLIKVTPIDKASSRITRKDQLVALGRDLLALVLPLPKPEAPPAPPATSIADKPF
jgi:Holliday junction resolvase RusA-like endonuclease